MNSNFGFPKRPGYQEFKRHAYEYGRIAVDREFVYIDFEDEWFPPCEGGEEVSEGLHGAYVGQKP